MKSCQACHHSVREEDAVTCATCGVFSHPGCSLARLVFVGDKPEAVPSCDRCFTLWLRTIPPLMQGYALALIDQQTAPWERTAPRHDPAHN